MVEESKKELDVRAGAMNPEMSREHPSLNQTKCVIILGCQVV